MRDNMRILEEINAVTEEERIAATQLAESATFRTFSPFEVRRHVAIFLERYADNKGPEATVKADSLRILAEVVHDETQEIYKMSNEYQARSVRLQNELDWLKLDLSVSHEQARNQARQEVAQELREAQAEVKRVKATHMPNEDYIKLQSELNSFDTTHVPNKVYTKKLNENQELREQLTGAKSQVKILEAENEELKQSIQTEADRVKATHMPNEMYTKRMREISKLKEQRAEAETQAFILETENEELKRRIQDLTK